jgi:hypothetical protein
MMTSEGTKFTLEITGTFEVAMARNRLRQAASAERLPLMLQARAAAAITRVAELVLFHGDVKNRQLKLVVLIHSASEPQGIEFQFFAPFRIHYPQDVQVAEWQLEQACDELEMTEHGSFDYVIMRLWARRKNV